MQSKFLRDLKLSALRFIGKRLIWLYVESSLNLQLVILNANKINQLQALNSVWRRISSSANRYVGIAPIFIRMMLTGFFIES
jgi:hypothetical protein